MNLSMSVIGIFHTAACVIALALGAYLMVGRKGSRRHRQLGDGYVVMILFASLSSLTIYTRHTFTAAHGFAVMAIATAVGGFALGRWHGQGAAWKYGHITCMLLSYYVLIGGGVNEVFLRVDTLRPILLHAPQVVGRVHGMVMLAFLGLIVGFIIATAISHDRLNARRRARPMARAARA